ncbi:MAG: recombination mediator RecR [Polyangiaceae bacterium]
MSPRLRRVIHLLSRLPGVGERTAYRYLLHLALDPTIAAELGRELLELAERVRPCELCGNLAETDVSTTCSICSDTRRDDSTLCVVAKVQDLLAMERSGIHRGRYFVLGKLLSPLEGIGPEDLPVQALAKRLSGSPIKEVILATPASVDGEATALLLRRELAALPVTVSRIASGIPHGGDLEFADPVTLGRAMDGRKTI